MKKQILFLVPILAVWLAGCAGAAATTPAPIKTDPAPVPSETVVLPEPTATEPAVVEEPAPTQPPEPTHAVPVTSLYRDDLAGYELDYPVGWMLEASAEVGSRASQATLASWGHVPGDVVTERPSDSTLVTLLVYQWDPKRDLAAYVAQRKLAWEASDFVILREENLTLSGLQPAQAFVIETPDKLQAFFLFTMVGDAYLQVSGDGNLDLVREIALTTRVFSQ